MTAVLALPLAPLVFAPEAVFACSCMGSGTAKEALEQSAVVFRGVIEDVEPASMAWSVAIALPRCGAKRLRSGLSFLECLAESYSEDYGDVAVMRVKKTWKGKATGAIRIHTWPGGGDFCGLRWRPGDEWIIYAHESSALHVLHASSCSRSVAGTGVKQEAEELDAATSGAR